MKKLLVLVLVLAMTMSLFACGSNDSGAQSSQPVESSGENTPGTQVETVSLKLGTQAPPSTPLYKWAEDYAAALSEASGGAIQVEIVGSSSLGTTAQHYSQLSQGTLDIFLTGFDSAAIMRDALDFNIFVMPYAFDDVNHFVRFVESDIFDEMCTPVEASNNVHFLGLLTIGNPRGLSTSNREVRTVADVENLKIRVPDSTAQIEVWKAWGANPVNIPASELYTSMESNICDGQENPLDGTAMSGYAEVQNYYTELDYIQQGTVLWMSQKTWDKLTEEQRGWLESARASCYETLSAECLEGLDGYRQMLIDAGMTVISDFDVDSFKKIAEEMVPQFEGQLFSAGLYEKIRSLSEG